MQTPRNAAALAALAWGCLVGVPASAATPPVATHLPPVRPAEVHVLPLADLGLAAPAQGISTSGAIDRAIVKDGTLRFATPGDTGVDQHARIQLTHAGTRSILDVTIHTELATAAVRHVEGPDRPAPARLVISGLGANNILRRGALIFRLEGAGTLDLAKDSDAVITAPGRAPLRLKDRWQFDPADSSFTMDAAAMSHLLDELPPGVLGLSLNVVSKDGEFAEVHDLTVLHARARMTGQLVDGDGRPVATLRGRTILSTGHATRRRAVATVDAGGVFRFDDVIPDTYRLTLGDLERPGVVTISAAVFADSTEVAVTMAYRDADVGIAPSTRPAGSVQQDGKAPPPRAP